MVNLDTRNWRLYVRHPKCGSKWAENRRPTIMFPYRQAFPDFLKKREELLRCYGRKEATCLIPNLRQGDNPYSSNHFRELKKEVQEVSGIDFKLEDFRPTGGQLALDEGVPIEQVSQSMRHASTKMTERYHCRSRADPAFANVNEAYNRMFLDDWL